MTQAKRTRKAPAEEPPQEEAWVEAPESVSDPEPEAPADEGAPILETPEAGVAPPADKPEAETETEPELEAEPEPITVAEFETAAEPTVWSHAPKWVPRAPNSGW